MKTKQIIFKRATLVMLAMSLFSFFNCSSDDDGSGEPETVSFSINLVKLTGVDTSTESGAMEVYGIISVKLNDSSNEEILWNKTQQEYIEVEEADYPISGSKTYTIETSELTNQSVIMSANLTEYDSNANNSDDPIGNSSMTIPLSSISNSQTFEILLNETEGHEVKLTYSITRL